MKVARLEAFPANVPYTHREISSQVARDGVTDIVVRVESDDGQVGWGEACSGADVRSVADAIRAMTPFVIGGDPWRREDVRRRLYAEGLWQFRAGTANFAFAGIDMALWDLCARCIGQPLHRLFGGAVREHVDYFYYLARGSDEELREQCTEGVLAGYEVFYLKVGLNDDADLAMVATAREALGPEPRLRLDANGAWSMPQALRLIERLACYDIDYIEQPVRDHPIDHLAELRIRSAIRVCANEGLWSEEQAYARITARQADVFCFSPYWVGGLAQFHRLAHIAHLEGLLVCKHTHGELGIAASAAQQLLLTLPNVVCGNQQTAQMMTGDVVREEVPIRRGSKWPMDNAPGIGVEVDEEALAEAIARYDEQGQYVPYDKSSVAAQS